MSISIAAQGHTIRSGVGASRLPTPTPAAASHPIKIPGSALQESLFLKKEFHFNLEVTKQIVAKSSGQIQIA